MAVVAACSVFVILLVSLFAFESPFPESGWSMFDPPGQDGPAPRFRRSLKKLAEMRGLSPRETEVFVLLAQGRTRAFIQDELVLSGSTVKTHVSHIYAKMGVHDRQEMMDLIWG